MGFENRHGAVPAQEGVLAGDGLPDQQTVEGIAVIGCIRKAMKG